MAKEQKIVEMPQVTDETLAEVIRLARLDPSDPSMAAQTEHLKRILAHFQVLSHVEIEGLGPTIQINPTSLPLRPDQVGESLDIREAIANARLKAGDFFQAPRIIGGEESDHA
jgi:aspartyl/glutamyl-tRNA(Asn/Gln) amidotransferase C subunit